jgi:hypothetical protein
MGNIGNEEVLHFVYPKDKNTYSNDFIIIFPGNWAETHWSSRKCCNVTQYNVVNLQKYGDTCENFIWLFVFLIIIALERCEVLAAVVMKSAIFRDVALLNPCCGCHLLHTALSHFILRPWKWRRYVPSKRLLTFSGLHGIISQKTATHFRAVEFLWKENPFALPELCLCYI